MLLFTRIQPTPYWRTLLILGRVSNLPTVWSNCTAGWLLGGGGTVWILVVICLGATCLYIGGMFLNDAFDVEFDREYRNERPIPSGQITLDAVWRWGFGWLGAGTVILVLLGKTTGAARKHARDLEFLAVRSAAGAHPARLARQHRGLPASRRVDFRDSRRVAR